MSTLKVNAIQNTSGVEQYLAKAWVNFNGTGTVAIRASGNVSSITDNGVGDYTVNFTTALADANYSAVSSAGTGGVGIGYSGPSGAVPTASNYRFSSAAVSASPTFADYPYVFLSIFR